MGSCVNTIGSRRLALDLGDAADAFFTMVRQNTEKYFLSSTRYSTNAFYRRQMGRRFTDERLRHRIYGNFSEAHAGLENDS